MADTGFLEKEYDAASQGQGAPAEEVYDEATEHRRRMAAKFEELCAQPVDYAKYAERAQESYFSSDRGEARYTDYPVENRAPRAATVTAPADAPNAMNRINDYMESSRRIVEMNRGLQMAAGEDYAPEMNAQAFAPFAPEAEMQAAPEMQYLEEPQFAAPRDEYMGWLYREGIVQSQELAPTAETPAETMPFHEFTGAYPAEETSSEEDALPSRETMGHYSEEGEIEDEEDAIPTQGIGSRTKIVLAAIAAAIMILLAVICINAAVIRSLNSDVSFREQTVTDLGETLRGIQSEIEDLTAPEYIESWAAEHGMTPPRS